MGLASTIVRQTIAAILGISFVAAIGCSGQQPTASAPEDSAARLKKEAAIQRRMHDREAHNR